MEQWEKSIVASWPRSELEKENAEVAYRAALGGIVLLENRGALPLTKGKIALYGIGARVYEKGGTGSGDVYTREPLSLKEALESEGYEITNASYLDRLSSSISEAEEKRDEEIIKRGKKYSAFDVAGLMGLLSLPAAAPEEPLLKEDDLPSERGTALYFIRRQAGEGRDCEEVPGDYLLSEVEKKNLLFLKSSFEKLIVVINSGSSVDPSFLKGLEAGALVYLGQAGSQGPKALAALISGRESFSGHLAVSWPLSLADLPSTARFSSRGSREKENYIEGIYVGYRFHDSFGVPAAYPFGYGLSYASFKASYSYSLKGDEVKVAASVENVSSLKGRPLIQVYLSCPSVSLPREYQGLAAYKKGKELAPGEKESLEMSFSLRDFAAYDEETSSYLLEEGEYLIRAGFSSVDAELIGSIRLSKRVLVERSFPLVKGKRVHEIAPLSKKRAETAPSYVSLDPSSIIPLFHERKAEIPDAEAQGYLAKLTHKEKLSLLYGDLDLTSGKTLSIPGAAGELNKDALRKMGLHTLAMADGPAGLRIRPVSYASRGGKVRAPGSIPYELRKAKALYRLVDKLMSSPRKGDRMVVRVATAFPTASLIASSFDDGLAREVGAAVSKEMEAFGVDIWLAPALNIVRHPLCGRNFEYFSEDPLLSGRMAASIVEGVESEGRGMTTVKHFACNNRENERTTSSSEVNERALREIYLKAFRYVVRKAKPSCLMTSYNLINGIYANSDPNLITRLLREEWGYEGYIMTDWSSCAKGQAKSEEVILAGGDIVMPGDKYEQREILLAAKEGRLPPRTIDRACQRAVRLAIKAMKNRHINEK